MSTDPSRPRRHQRPHPALAVLSLCVIAVMACSLGGSPAATATPEPQVQATQPPEATEVVEVPPTETAAPAASTVTIDITDSKYTPATLEIPAGTTVIWIDNGSFPHTVTADDGAFDSGQLAKGDTFEFTFDTATTIAFHCEFHGGAGGVGMSGAITVNAAAEPTPANA